MYKEILPHAQKYIKKRERKRLIDEQLGSRSHSPRQANQSTSENGAQYVELKRLAKKNNSGRQDTSADYSHTDANTYQGEGDGLGSFTSY